MRSLRRSAGPVPLPTPSNPGVRRGVTRVRVRYCECDPMRVAHHGAFAPWLEIARTEALRDSGVTYAQLEEAGVFLVVTRLEVRYRRPALYDDQLDVHVRVTRATRVKLEHEYSVVLVERAGARVDTGEVLAEGATTLACVDAEGRPGPLPEFLVPAECRGR